MKYIDFSVQTFLMLVMLISHPYDQDGYTAILTIYMWPWQILSAIVNVITTRQLNTARQLYLAFSLGYLLAMIPLFTSRAIEVEAVYIRDLFVVPGILAFVYYLLTVRRVRDHMRSNRVHKTHNKTLT